MPRIPGSASGLRVTPCMTAPETLRAAPTMTASRVRGMRLATAAGPKPSVEPPNAERMRSEEHTSELQSRGHLVCRLLLEKKKETTRTKQEYRAYVNCK